MMERAPFFSELAEGPANGEAYWIKAEDQTRIRIGLWSKKNTKKGTIFLFPGRTEYIELQGRTARDFAAQGYAIFTIDWRGHGLSDRVTTDPITVHIDSFLDYQKDVRAMINAAKELGLPKPWFLLANSMGGCIGLRTLLEGIPFAACAFTAPMWGIEMTRLQRLISLPVTWAACSLGRGHKYIPGHDGKHYALNTPFDGNRISSDADGYDYWVNQVRHKPELQTAGSSMRWLQQSLLECRHLSKQRSPIIPCVTFWGQQDRAVDLTAINNRMARWPNGSFEQLVNAKHGLLLERPEIRAMVITKIGELFSTT